LKFFLAGFVFFGFVPANTVQKTMAIELTQRQKEILEYLRMSQRKTGIMPSTRELQHYFGFSSQTAAMSHLRALERKGVIQRLAGKARAVVFPEDLDRGEISDIPLYGNIAAGMAQDVENQTEGCIAVDIAALGIPRNAKTFALKVRGDSMIDAHICDGDVVILEFRQPRKGDVVAALIDGETTLKRYLVERGQPFLRAENQDYPDLIPARELVIQGVLIALLRHVH
jgi:repressor LexA